MTFYTTLTILLSTIEANRLLRQTVSKPQCCNVAEKPSWSQCFEGYECCPDGTWTCSIGDGITYPCGNNYLKKGIDTFGIECPSVSPDIPSNCLSFSSDPYCNSYTDGCYVCNCHTNTCKRLTPCIPPITNAFHCNGCVEGYIFNKITRECEQDPCTCDNIYEPVCCNDGKHYSNQCVAECQGITMCKPIISFLSWCEDPCAPYSSVQCNGYPNAKCQAKVNCNGCHAAFVDANGNEIECIHPTAEPVKIACDGNNNICKTAQGFGCRKDFLCWGSNLVAFCEKVCLNVNGLCSVNTECGLDYKCVNGFCVKYQVEIM